MYVADETNIDLGPTADLFATKIHLDHTNAFRVELGVGKVGTKHEKDIALLHGAIGGWHADEAVEPHEIGVVILQILFSTKGGDDWSLQSLCHGEDFRTGVCAACSRQDGHFLCLVEQLRCGLEACFGRQYGSSRTIDTKIDRHGGTPACQDTAGNDDDRDASLGNGCAHSDSENAGYLFGAGDDLTKVRTREKKVFGLRLLKIVGPEFSAGYLRGDRQHGNTAALAIMKSIDKVEVARPATSCADRKFACNLRFASGGESRDLFVPDHHPIDAIVSADGVCKSVERVTGDSVDALDARFQERLDDDISDFGQHLLSKHLRLDAI